MNPPRYTLRVSLNVLGQEPIKGLEAEPSITVGQITVTVKQRRDLLILLAGDFDSEAEAEAFLPQIKTGLWNIAIEHNIAFVPHFERRRIRQQADPEQAARNHFGVLIGPVKPAYGFSEEQGYTIFRSEENICYFSAGDVHVSLTTGWDSVSKTLAEAIRNARQGTNGQEALSTAVDLYLAHFYETSIRARFLTLIMCLEVLAPRPKRHPIAV